jgi:ribosome-associated protein
MKKTPTTSAKKKLVIAALEDIKAHDILAIDVRKVTPIFDWIILASADSGRQTKALARHVRDKLKEAGSAIVGTEGEESGEWILVDAGDIVAHVMQPAVRDFYNLEELWGEGKFDKVVNSSRPVDAGTPRRKAPARKKAAAAPAATPVPRKKRASTSRKAA